MTEIRYLRNGLPIVVIGPMKMTEKKVSIKDIARLSGVSVATVSRIINKNGRYSIETEKRVQKVMESNGYTLNAIAKSLRTNKSNCIGVIVPDITNEFFARIVRSVEDAALKYNYSVFVCNTNEDVHREVSQLKKLQEQSVDGLVYISGSTHPNASWIASKPVVYVDRHLSAEGNFVQSDNMTGGYMAAKALIAKGCKRILLLKDGRKLSPVIHRETGYKKALKEHGLPFDKGLSFAVRKVAYQEAKDAVEIALKQKVNFDGIFATNDWLALGAVHALSEHGCKIPEEVKVIGFDDISISHFSYPKITTIRQDTQNMGRAAVEQLMQSIKGKQPLPNHITLIPVELVNRFTT